MSYVFPSHYTQKQKAQFFLERAKKGDYGTFENQKRGYFSNDVFWQCALGQRKASEYKGTISYPKALAGEMYANSDK